MKYSLKISYEPCYHKTLTYSNKIVTYLKNIKTRAVKYQSLFMTCVSQKNCFNNFMCNSMYLNLLMSSGGPGKIQGMASGNKIPNLIFGT